jgi:DNA topoisomerase-1
VNPANNEPILVDLGRYGPYLRCGTDTRSLKDPSEIFGIDLDGALAVLATEKKGRGRGAEVLRELGATPEGVAVKLLAGRYGPYVSDGETNASVPKDREAESVQLPDALEWLAARRAAGPSKKKRARKAAGGGATKKTAKKAAKKTAKKATKRASKKAAGEAS